MTQPVPKKILVVDDEPDVVTYLAALLEDNGYAVVSAADGKEGFAKCLEEHPDLITLDITMPEESGVRMFRELREHAEMAAVPVVIITGISSDFKRFLASRKHVRPPEEYFEKPIEREQLLTAIRRLLGQESQKEHKT